MDDRMKQLVEQLNEHAHAYYVLDEPSISDGEYDRLYDELLQLEEREGTRLPDSPTRRVGADPVKAFESHAHLARLWSLEKCKSKQEFESWQQRLDRNMGDRAAGLEFSLEYKIDGLTINLTYDGGHLMQAATRGNGSVGEGILPQVMTIKSIPLSVPFKGRFEVQGEGYMPLSAFYKYNETAAEPLKNARNGAAGALRNLNPDITASRNLDAFFYNVGFIQGKRFANTQDMLGFLAENRFRVSPVLGYYHNAIDAYDAAMDLNEQRKGEDFLTDGMVVKVTDFAVREELGNTDRFPRWAIAIKFEAEEATTTIDSISWDVGRSGKLTPLAHLAPVEIGGVTVRKATLNNANDIKRKGVKLGGSVWIRRSGDVIPEIMGAVGTEGEEIPIPDKCPFCGADVEERGALIYCTNNVDCKPQMVYALDHYASREGMDIVGLSERTVRMLMDNMGVRKPSDLYKLDAVALAKLDGFGEKRAQNLMDSLEASKQRGLAEFIYAIGIPNVGKATATDIARRYGSIDSLKQATVDDLLEIPEIGSIIADGIVKYFADEENIEELQQLKQLGIDPKADTQHVDAEGILTGRNIVFTGSLSSMSRGDAGKLAQQHGAEVSGSISKKVNLVVAGEKAGSKLEKAQKLGIEVVSEEGFFDMLERA